ncbi:MAG: hypothetical protein AAF549_01595 [Pseudomonadota bacterium]
MVAYCPTVLVNEEIKSEFFDYESRIKSADNTGILFEIADQVVETRRKALKSCAASDVEGVEKLSRWVANDLQAKFRTVTSNSPQPAQFETAIGQLRSDPALIRVLAA